MRCDDAQCAAFEQRAQQAFGANPKGINTFDANGRFTVVFIRPDLPKVASNDRVRLTPEEAMAIAKGVIAYYGTYTVGDLKQFLAGRNVPIRR